MGCLKNSGGKMKFPANTEWKLSAKGNHWRKLRNKTLVVGGDSESGYWVLVGQKFLPDRQESLEEAMLAAEDEAE
jgi:hypothetical protein